MHVLGLWEEAGVLGENPQKQEENMQTHVHTQKGPGRLEGVKPETFLLQTALNMIIFKKYV